MERRRPQPPTRSLFNLIKNMFDDPTIANFLNWCAMLNPDADKPPAVNVVQAETIDFSELQKAWELYKKYKEFIKQTSSKEPS